MEKSKTKLVPFKANWIFERYNSKYNRLWEQMTQCGLLVIQIVTGYIFALMAIQSLSNKEWMYSFFFVVTTLMFLCVVIGRLELERLKTKNFLNEYLNKNPN